MSENFFQDNPDLLFQLRLLDWDALVRLTETDPKDTEAFKKGSEAREAYEQVLESLGAFAALEVAPHWKELDESHPHHDRATGEVEDPPRMKTIMKGLAQLGAMGLAIPRRLGGFNAPMVVDFAAMELLARADTTVMSHFGFHGGIGAALMLYSVEEGSFTQSGASVTSTRYDDAIRKMASGQEWGAMVLTEAGAGSDLGEMRTTAKLQPDGSWRITGSKIFITSGHGEHHIVIARSEDPVESPGLRGLSLFYVPGHVIKDGKSVRNFTVGGVERKMGQHAAVAATINYEDSVATLIGDRKHGFRLMLLLMNNARIAVGFQALGIMEAAYRLAKEYAQNRVTMGKPIAKHEMIAEYLDDMDMNIKTLRAMCFEAAFNQEAAERIRVALRLNPPADKDALTQLQRQQRRYQRRARKLTPLIKYFAGEEAVRAARMGMQIFGGLGYIWETGAEKLLRDALVLPIYEGTSQIQALMALKDNLQAAIRNPGRFLGMLANSMVSSIGERDPAQRALARLQGLANGAMQTIAGRIVAAKVGDLKDVPLRQWRGALVNSWDPQKDFSFGMLHAERLTQLLIAATAAEVLLQQAHAVADTPHARERMDLAERWMQRMEPRCKGIVAELEASADQKRAQAKKVTPKPSVHSEATASQR